MPPVSPREKNMEGKGPGRASRRSPSFPSSDSDEFYLSLA